MNLKCNECGFEHNSKFKTCLGCGELNTEIDWLCNECGSKNLQSTVSCRKCGHSYEKEKNEVTSVRFVTRAIRFIAGGLTILNAFIIFSARHDIFRLPNPVIAIMFLILGIALIFGRGASLATMATFVSVLSTILMGIFNLRTAEEVVVVDAISIIVLILILIRIKDFGYESVGKLINSLNSK